MARHIFRLAVLLLLVSVVWISVAGISQYDFGHDYRLARSLAFAVDTPETLPFPMDENDDPYSQPVGGFQLNNPSNISSELIYNPETGLYEFNQNIGEEIEYRPPATMTLDEYKEYDMEKSLQKYWNEKFEAENFSASSGFKPKIDIGGEKFDRIFGGNSVDIRPQGSAELSFGINVSNTKNPQLPVKQRRVSTFDFNEKIQLNVVGNIGEKLKLTTNYNTEATFDYENQMKLEYTGYEDEIIQKIEAGNVSLPLTGSLITGSQSLFGIKTEMKFGRLTATSIFTQDKGNKSSVQTSGGAQTNTFELKADNYEANKHFFLSTFFRNQYNDACATLPQVSSGVSITRIEVWVTNTTSNIENNRNIVAFQDLGEDKLYLYNQAIQDNAGNTTLPHNAGNSLYASMHAETDIRNFSGASQRMQSFGMNPAVHYEKIESARRLSSSEYTYNTLLGFISLNQALNNSEVLAVAYEYTFQGQTYVVGDLSTDGISAPQALYLKLLKGTITNTSLPTWDLMMKNVYSIGAFQVNREQFKLDITYANPRTGVEINYIPQAPIDGIPLLQVVRLDRLNPNTSPTPDGVFDFVDDAATRGGTINSRNGRVYFPVIEPFGQTIIDKLKGVDPNIVKTIAFPQLYDSTKTAAQQIPAVNRFYLRGTYQSSSSSEISLNQINIPKGSVRVTAGGVPLIENQDYTVDYTLGRVKIINSGLLESQTPINVSLESNSLFSIQTRSLFGTHFDYDLHDDATLGATILNLTERPLTQKVNMGSEPISNTIWGVNGDYRMEAPIITKLVDKLPLINTKEKSTITVGGEFAHIIPGHSRAIGKTGTSYIDDFEGSQTSIDIRSQNTWVLASVPQGQPNLFPEASLTNDLKSGYKRAKMAWYVIDPLFFRDNNTTPPNIVGNVEMQSNHLMREVYETEVFPNKQFAAGTPTNIPVFDLAYYPKERGPYNYDPNLNTDGEFEDPENRWAGIMRRIETTDFEMNNIEFIQFWLMDPFNSDALDPNERGGELYFNLGEVSEDILRDERKSFEHGLPPVDSRNPSYNPALVNESAWGQVSTISNMVTNTFDNDVEARGHQDVGFDGLSDVDERSFFSEYLAAINASAVSATAKARINDDPSGDNYHYFRGDDFDAEELNVLERYKFFNGPHGNSPTDEQSSQLGNTGNYPTSATTIPTTEDINNDNTLNENESYFQYLVKLKKEEMVVGRNYITDEFTSNTPVKDGSIKVVKWYQFKIPVREPDKVINGMRDFRSIRFIRMFTRGFQESMVLRFARLELIRGEWRRYDFSLQAPGEGFTTDNDPTSFNIAAVNREENGERTPIPYVVPPNILQEVDVGSTNLRRLNEQSLVLEVCDLQDGDARAGYRNVTQDVRSYKKLRMFVHVEAGNPNAIVNANDLTMFCRLGSDFENNYYEYEVPLTPTPFGETQDVRIWPSENDMEIDFEDLRRVKTTRNNEFLPLTTPYSEMDGANKITVVGNPTLSDLKTIMIGIRNPSAIDNVFQANDDGLPKCAEMWVNELRLTDFDEHGGWAALARTNIKMADLANVSLAGNISTPGFGSIEKKVSERQRETRSQVDASTNIELGRFVPEKVGMKVPLFLGYSEGVSTPQFDPRSPDLLVKESISSLDKEQKRFLLDEIQSVTQRRSLNFTNVRKERSPSNVKKARFYDVENLALSYSYNEINMHNYITEYNHTRQHRAGINYGFNANPKNVTPFSNIKFLKKQKYLKLVRDINFYTGPKSVSFSTDVNRTYNQTMARATAGFITFPQYTKQFNWNRLYDVKYDLTKALKLDFNAQAVSLIGEPDRMLLEENGTDSSGIVDRKGEPYAYEQFKDSVRQSFLSGGTPRTYGHNFNATYTWPINKIPFLSFLNLTTRYNSGYNWNRAPLTLERLGNTIDNNRGLTWNAQANLTTLYNKSKYLKEVHRKGPSPKSRAKPDIKTKDGKPATPDSSKKEIEILKHIVRVLTSLNSVAFTYGTNHGTVMPGYAPSTSVLGMSQGFGSPGVPFILGAQDPDIAEYMSGKNWLVKDSSLNTAHTRTFTRNLNYRATFEPVQSLRIEFSGLQNFTRNNSEYYRHYDSIPIPGEFQGLAGYSHDSPIETGSFSTSVITWKTAFIKPDKKDNHSSKAFDQFLADRIPISDRLASENPNSNAAVDGFWDGYGENSQDVIIPAFLAAYTGRGPVGTKLDAFSMTPMPNWRVNYDGLGKIPALKKIFRNVSLSHSYRSTFNISAYTTNLNYTTDDDGNPNARDVAGNFIPRKQVQSIGLQEQLSPLFNVDMTLNNNVLAKFEIKKDRNLAYSLANGQLTEVLGKEFVIGGGYRIADLQMPFTVGGKGKPVSDLNLRADVSIRKNTTITRTIDRLPPKVTAGGTNVSVKTSADYKLNEKINVRLFFDTNAINPSVSNTFPTSNTNAGISLRFTL